mgnify:CR=1 FL=1
MLSAYGSVWTRGMWNVRSPELGSRIRTISDSRNLTLLKVLRQVSVDESMATAIVDVNSVDTATQCLSARKRVIFLTICEE